MNRTKQKPKITKQQYTKTTQNKGKTTNKQQAIKKRTNQTSHNKPSFASSFPTLSEDLFLSVRRPMEEEGAEGTGRRGVCGFLLPPRFSHFFCCFLLPQWLNFKLFSLFFVSYLPGLTKLQECFLEALVSTSKLPKNTPLKPLVSG